MSECRPVIGWRGKCGTVIGGEFSGQAGYSITSHNTGRHRALAARRRIQQLLFYFNYLFNVLLTFSFVDLQTFARSMCMRWPPVSSLSGVLLLDMIQFVCAHLADLTEVTLKRDSWQMRR